MIRKISATKFLFVMSFCCTSILQAHISEELRLAVASKSYTNVKHALQKKSDDLDAHELETLAKQYKDEPLLRAVEAYKSVANNRKLWKMITRKEFLQTALFIESKLPQEAHQYHNYMNKVALHIPLSVMYDPSSKNTFISLDRKDGAELGEGMFKTVNRALLYGKHPEVVAKATQTRDMGLELELTKKVAGSPGIFEIKGFTSHEVSGRKRISIYSKIYNSGSLQDVFDNKVRLSKWERAIMALNLLTGLDALHSHGIVHRDLGCRNYLVNIPEGRVGRRRVEAVIADLGCSDYAKNSIRHKVQGNNRYVSPEGLFIKKMKRDDYYKSDVFALGNVLYQLFHKKEPDWQVHHWVKYKADPVGERHREMVECMEHAIGYRRRKMEHKKRYGRMTPRNKFESLILKMLNPDPKHRPSARELKHEMQAIFQEMQ